MHYELWTVPSGNIVDDFASEGEALALVRELTAGTPPDAADSLLLTLVRDDGSGASIAAGAAPSAARTSTASSTSAALEARSIVTCASVPRWANPVTRS